MLLCLYIDSFFKKLTFITMFLLTVLVLGAKNLQKLPNRYRHLRLSFATYNSDWSKVSDVSEPLRNTCCYPLMKETTPKWQSSMDRYFPSISYYFHIPKIFLIFFPHTGKNRNRRKSNLLP